MHSDPSSEYSLKRELEQLSLRIQRLERSQPVLPAQASALPKTLTAISQIWRASGLDHVLQTAVTAVVQMLQAERGVLIRCAAHRSYGYDEVVAEHRPPEFPSLKQLPRRSPPIGDRLLTAAQKGEVVRLSQLDGWTDASLLLLEQLGTQTGLSAPVFVADELWGLLCVHQCSTWREWTSEEIQALATVAEHLGLAIAHAKTLAEAQRRSEMLQTSLVTELRKRADELTLQTQRETAINRVIRKIRQTLDTDVIFSTAAGETRALLGCDRVSVYRFHADWSGEFVWESLAQGWRPLIIGDSIRTTWADSYLQETTGGRYRHQESFAVDDVYRAGHTACHLEILEQFQVRAYCVVPIFVGTTLWGLMAAYQHSGPRAWKSEEVNLLARIGSQVGVALQHTQAVDQLRRQSQQLQQALERERAVAMIIDKIRRSLDIDTIFQTTAQEVRQLIQADRVAIYRFNKDWSGRFVVEAVGPGWKSLLREQQEHSGLCRDISDCSIRNLADAALTDTYLQATEGGFNAHGKVFRVVSDIYEAGFSDCYIQLLESLQARAYAIVAIYQNQSLWGLLAAYQNAEPRQWQDHDTNFLVEVSSHLGVALQQAELLGRAEQRSTTLQTTLEIQLRQRAKELEQEAERERAVAKIIDKIRYSLDLNTIFQTTATEVRQLLQADRVAMLQFIPGTNWHRGEFVAEDVLPKYTSAICNQLEDHCFAEHRAEDYRRGRIWSLDDIHEAKLQDCYRQILDQFQVRANLVVPLIKGDELWGLLCIHQCAGPRHWTNQDREFVTQIATQLGVALQQAEFLKQLQQAKEAADAANTAKSKFLANMSHELRTPLNAILGFAQLMSRDASLQPDQTEHLEIIVRSGEHLLSLINDVLEMSKIEAGQLTLNESSLDLYRLLYSIEDMLELKAESKGLRMVCDRAPEVPQYIRADESKLRQVLINLLGNGIKFTETGYVALRIWVEVSDEAAPFRTYPLLHFEVEDTGLGIDPKDLKYLFEAFGQTESGRRSQEGTGLGLPISQTFVRLMGGTITVESKPGAGSTFRFAIPLKSADESEVPPVVPCRRVIGLEPDQPNYHVLVVEDKWENRQLLLRLLTSVGFEVREATNGQEALHVCQHWRPHLIWMDMRMPVMDGYEATRAIKARYEEESPIILALTANAFEEDRLVALSLGCDDFIRKPCQEQIVLEKMAEYLNVRYVYADSGSSSAPESNPAPANTVEPDAATCPDPDASPVPGASDLNVLVAEDNLVNQQLMAQLLKHLGHQAHVVGNGLEALEALRQQPFDVVLMDVQMPEMDGLTATQQIRQEWPADGPTVIALTGHTSQEKQAECLAAGMDACLTKPVNLPALTEALKQCPSRSHPPLEIEPLTPASLDQTMLEQIRLAAGDRADEFLVTIIDSYFKDAPGMVQAIKEAIAQKQPERLGDTAHPLKTMSANLGAIEFAQLCQQLEKMQSIDQLSPADDLLDQVQQEFDRFMLALKAERQDAQGRLQQSR
ncbi:MAG: GAF domain-containing protein [Elainellaceae cyanobacterium]